jgi:hypothetical protein
VVAVTAAWVSLASYWMLPRTGADESTLGSDSASDPDEGTISSEPIAHIEAALPVIGQLRSSKHHIIIYAFEDGPRFTVATPQGTVIATVLSADEMRVRHPEIFEMYKSTFAGSGGYLDASAGTVQAIR